MTDRVRTSEVREETFTPESISDVILDPSTTPEHRRHRMPDESIVKMAFIEDVKGNRKRVTRLLLLISERVLRQDEMGRFNTQEDSERSS